MIRIPPLISIMKVELYPSRYETKRGRKEWIKGTDVHDFQNWIPPESFLFYSNIFKNSKNFPVAYITLMTSVVASRMVVCLNKYIYRIPAHLASLIHLYQISIIFVWQSDRYLMGKALNLLSFSVKMAITKPLIKKCL